MKVRSGFVSNSSSSSYVICVAKVTDEEKLRAFCEMHNLDCEVYTTEEALNYDGWNRKTTKRGDKTYFYNESFDGNEVSIEMDTEANEKLVSLSYYEDIMEDEDGPVEPDFIEDGGIYSLKEENGVTDINVTQGYGRNG